MRPPGRRPKLSQRVLDDMAARLGPPEVPPMTPVQTMRAEWRVALLALGVVLTLILLPLGGLARTPDAGALRPILQGLFVASVALWLPYLCAHGARGALLAIAGALTLAPLVDLTLVNQMLHTSVTVLGYAALLTWRLRSTLAATSLPAAQRGCHTQILTATIAGFAILGLLGILLHTAPPSRVVEIVGALLQSHLSLLTLALLLTNEPVRRPHIVE